MIFVFDLDHTVIDSSHRQLTRADGSLCLDHWKENCTREKIFGDSLLPLADEMRNLISKGRQVLVCTARVMSEADYEFLIHHGIMPDCVLSREEGDHSGDAVLKENLFRMYCQNRKIPFARFMRSVIMFDDNQDVISHLREFGMNINCAIKANKLLTKAA